MEGELIEWFVFNITNLCNFKCSTCLRGYGRKGNLSLKLFKQLLPDLKRVGIQAISFTGGEPCLHPEFKSLIEAAVRHDFYIDFVSNGSLLERYQFIIEKYRENLPFVAFSVDGPTREIHERNRPPGSYKKVIRSIEYFIAHGIFTKIFVCLSKLNKDAIPGMFGLGSRLGANSLVFSAAIATTANKEIVLSDQEKDECVEIIRDVNKFAGIRGFLTASLWTRGGVNFCRYLGVEALSVNPKGELVFCCNTIRDGAVIGSLEKERFEDLYSSALDIGSELKRIRMRLMLENKRIDGMDTCEFCNQFLAKKIN